MRKLQYTDESVGLSKLIDQINALSPQLRPSFQTDEHETRYLRRAVMAHAWAQQPTSQTTTARYSFAQFATSLNESLQLKEEYPEYVNNRATPPNTLKNLET